MKIIIFKLNVLLNRELRKKYVSLNLDYNFHQRYVFSFPDTSLQTLCSPSTDGQRQDLSPCFRKRKNA